MHTFCQIIHKTTSDTDTFYNYSTTNNNSIITSYDFTYNAFNASEYKINQYNNNLSYEEKMVNQLIKVYLHMFVGSILSYSVQSKLLYFKKTIDNQFLNESTRTQFINHFCKIQQKYWILNKLVYNYKWKKAKYQNQTDLILNPINKSQHNVITILHNNNKYLFTVSDLKKIIEGALCNSPLMISSPSPPKNPYNNMPFEKAVLYYIYFFMKCGNFVLSNIFHNYFLCNFNLTQFRLENQVLIRKNYIEHYISNANLDELYLDGLELLKNSKHTNMMKIHKDFPKKTLVDAITPYLRIYFSHIYSLDVAERNHSVCELNRQLKQFYKFNPKFGRIFIKTVKGKPNEVSFNEKYIQFRGKDLFRNYDVSHLELDDSEDEYDHVIESRRIENNRMVNRPSTSYRYNRVNVEVESLSHEGSDSEEYEDE